MKILAVSDEVLDILYSPAVGQRYKGIDLLIGCGDLPFYYMDFLTSALDAPMIYVLGNHDGGRQYTSEGGQLTGVRGGINIHGMCVSRCGMLIAGLEGSMRYRPNAPLMYTESEMRWEVARLIPRLLWNKTRYGRALDILVTHSPPWQIHDREDLAHTGFKVFRTLLERFEPRYMLHGHIHLYTGRNQETQFGVTRIINVYPYYSLDLE